MRAAVIWSTIINQPGRVAMAISNQRFSISIACLVLVVVDLTGSLMRVYRKSTIDETTLISNVLYGTLHAFFGVVYTRQGAYSCAE